MLVVESILEPPRSGRVLVLGSDTRSFLGVVRSLGRYGLEVESAWSNASSVALTSRFLTANHDLPLPWESDNWIDSMNHLMRSREYDLVIPCNDPSLIPLQAARDQLLWPKRYYLLDHAVFEITQSKARNTELAQSLGIPVPEHRVIKTVEEGIEFSKLIGFPVVLKPISSYSENKLTRKRTVATVQNEKELKLVLSHMLQHSLVQAQEYFDGVGTGVEFLANNGETQFAFQHLRLHEPLKGGGSSYRKSITLHPGMLKAAQEIVAKLRYSGVGMVEFRWDRQTDQWTFVEVNGRFWGSLPLAIASDADFPKYLYQSQVEQVHGFLQQYRTGVCCRNWERDKRWFSEIRSTHGNLRFFKTGVLEISQSLGRIATLREHSDTFALDDPKPGLSEIASIAHSILSGGFHKFRSALANTSFCRNRNRNRLVELIPSTRSILFVCKGNICRSSFAQRYASKVMPANIALDSAGYFPRANRPAPVNAQEAARQLNVNLTDHRSKTLTQESVGEVDLILVFDQENFDRVRKDFPTSKRKTFFIKNIELHDDLIISDPFSSSVDNFVQTYQRIQRSIDELAKRLIEFQKS